MMQTSLVRNGNLVQPPTFTSVEAERRQSIYYANELVVDTLLAWGNLSYFQKLWGAYLHFLPSLYDLENHRSGHCQSLPFTAFLPEVASGRNAAEPKAAPSFACRK